MRKSKLSPEDRFWSNIIVVENCWEWAGPWGGSGYGLMSINNVSRGAHRRAWELLRGPIPEGLTIDHLCRNRGCVNPEHMEIVPFRENVLRGFGPTARNSRAELCVRGHAFAMKKDGTRWCPTCAKERSRAYGASHRSEINERGRARHRMDRRARIEAGLCTECGLPRGDSGSRNHCAACRAKQCERQRAAYASRSEIREKVRDRVRAWRAANPEKRREQERRQRERRTAAPSQEAR